MSELPPTTSVKRWFVTTNHKDIGILYTITALFFLLFGGVLALLIRMQLWDPTSQILSGLAYNEAVTAHGLIMVFWFLSPFGFGFANYFVPLQIGADDLAFPRLNALSYWMYLFSGVLLGISFFQGGTLRAPGGRCTPRSTSRCTRRVSGRRGRCSRSRCSPSASRRRR